MATLLLTAVGTAVGGPIGGAIGGLLGRQVDGAVFGNGSTNGPRLKELSVTTSSYGQPIPRIFGRMRVAGSVIWATDLMATTQKDGGGKGKPSTTSYSYSASFAVALSSLPISRVGRIWANGELLRGANDDLKVGGTIRVYLGHGDDPVDPLISADKGASAPAFRDTAYAVFEDLQLADFGNRIPALTFEIFGQTDASVSLDEFVPQSVSSGQGIILPEARGFSDEGGSLSSTLSAIDRVYPLTCVVTGDGLTLSSTPGSFDAVPILPEQLSSRDSSDAAERYKQRGEQIGREPVALRYYDEGRDYQPGIQRANGPRTVGRETTIDLPATLTAAGAKQLANANAHRSRWRHERITWRVGQLDPEIRPGIMARLPDAPGHWLVRSWEWYERGIELELERVAPQMAAIAGSDSGTTMAPLDIASPATDLAAIEVPADSPADNDTSILFAVASASNATWKGAALYVEQGTSLVPIGTAGASRAILGELSGPLPPSSGSYLEANAALEVTLYGDDLAFQNADLIAIANGANRLCVGGEILQFMTAEQISQTGWRLQGLLRGRGGTEDAALVGHPAGTSLTQIDDRLTRLNELQVPSDPSTRVAAIGRGDEEPVFASLQNAGLSRRPPMPVHPRIARLADNALEFCWTRRARGHWRWDALGEVPIVEAAEQYTLGYGSSDQPSATWSLGEAHFILSAAEQATLVDTFGSAALWVKQVGTFSLSPPLMLAALN